jgi:rubrerythrin
MCRRDIANLQARLAEREDKQAANFQKLQADLIKQIRRLTARLSEQERRHKREIEELRIKAAPTENRQASLSAYALYERRPPRAGSTVARFIPELP